ncbi:fungal specific transcription factor [Hirsutella rhossiliensis]|uniref:Fungal specific transcription factor domain-containing protein n=1 Tax=Hirsutella rhossiliensis TaxID=111463 RepID=A0A9P8SJ78_9HYPO|nr:fungal specific transcription factor domain-containing protein [Hirsutella rhossiliensis]KAH0965013.1 fungal specific transcription factor domain-containing protein [Hirsutella rhossiliensis]
MVHQSQRPWSCDRCHALKERCRWTPGSFHCERCSRLGHLCQRVRPLRKPGRPSRDSLRLRAGAGPLSNKKSSNGRAGQPPSIPSPVALYSHRSSSSASPTDRLATVAQTRAPLVRNVSVNGDLSGLDLRLLDRILFRDDFLEQFVVGPSFCESHRKLLVSRLLSCKPALQDSYLAFGLLWSHEPSLLPDGRQLNDSFKRASSALSTLRSFQVRDAHDVSVCLVLGLTILSFATKLGATDARTICNQTLSLVKPIYKSKPCPDPADYGFIYCLVLTDIAECLLLTKLPTLRLELPPGTDYVDRHVGPLATLLPHLHDICELSSAMLHGSAPGAPACDVAEALDALELAIHAWRPPMPKGLAARFSAAEVAHMVCQAQTMRAAAMLILHRLRHPFGSQLESARALSSTILTQLDLTVRATGKVPRCVDLPLIIACLELEDEAVRARWLRSMSPIGAYSSPFHERIKRMLTTVWAGRRHFSAMYWYHLGSFTSLIPDPR